MLWGDPQIGHLADLAGRPDATRMGRLADAYARPRTEGARRTLTAAFDDPDATIREQARETVYGWGPSDPTARRLALRMVETPRDDEERQYAAWMFRTWANDGRFSADAADALREARLR